MWLECIGVASVCYCIRRYIDFLIILLIYYTCIRSFFEAASLFFFIVRRYIDFLIILLISTPLVLGLFF